MEPAEQTNPRPLARDRCFWGWAAVVFLLHAWLWPHWPLLHDPNQYSRLYLVRSLVEDHSLCVDRQVERFGAIQDLAAYGGHYYSDKAIGQPLIGAVFYWPIFQLWGADVAPPLLLYLLSLLTAGLPTALIAAGLYRELRPSLGASAHLAAAAYALGTPALVYGSLYYGHQLAAGWVFLGYSQLRRQRLGTAGLCFGAAVLTEYPVALLCAPLVVLGLWRAGSVSAQLRLLSGLLLAAVVQGLYSFAIFGTPFELPYGHEVDALFATGHAQGWFGMKLIPAPQTALEFVVGLKKGLLIYAPVCLLALGAPFLGGSSKPVHGRAVLLGLLMLFLGTSSYFNPRYWSTGPRMLLPGLPLLFLFLGQWGSGLPLRMLAFLSGVGLVNSGLPALTFPLLPPEAEDPIASLAANLALQHGTTFTLGGWWMPLEVSAAALALGLLGLLLVAAGRRGWTMALTGTMVTLALTEARRPNPTESPQVGLLLALTLRNQGRLQEAASIQEEILERFRLPPEHAASLRAETQQLLRAEPPSLRPELWLTE